MDIQKLLASWSNQNVYFLHGIFYYLRFRKDFVIASRMNHKNVGRKFYFFNKYKYTYW